MSWKKLLLVLVLAVVMVPVAGADVLDFSNIGGTWSWSGLGTSYTMSSGFVIASHQVGGSPVAAIPLLGFGPNAALELTSGVSTGVNLVGDFVFAPGGTFTLYDALCGGACFTGTLVSAQLGDVGGNFTFSASFVNGVANTALLAALGFPLVPTDYFGSLSIPLGIDSNGVTLANGGFGSGGSGDIVLHPVPEVGTLAMFGSGLIGIAGLLRRKLNL